MAASITRGKTFTANEEVTNAKLHDLADLATVAGIDQTNMAANLGLCEKKTSQPTDDDALWTYTTIGQTLNYNALLSAYSGAAGVLRMTAYENLAAGDLVWPYNDSGTAKARKVRVGVPATPICDGPKAIGTAMTSATAGNAAFICTGGGPTYFLCDETIALGAAVRPSTSTDGRVETADQGDPACVGFLLEGGSAGNAALGIFVPIARAPLIYPLSTHTSLFNDNSNLTTSWTDCDCTSYVVENTSPTHAIVQLRIGLSGYSADCRAVIQIRIDGSSDTYDGTYSTPYLHVAAFNQTTTPPFLLASGTTTIELSSSFVFEAKKEIVGGSCTSGWSRVNLLGLIHVP